MMRSVIDEFRKRDLEILAVLTVAERVSLALSLGERDIETYARANGITAQAARRALQKSRTLGRRASRSADSIDGDIT
jgi:hypothetical protein